MRRFPVYLAAILCLVSLFASDRRAYSAQRPGRIFILMVWDGLRPDLVDAHQTPSLATFAHNGALLEHHHSVFPTITMVDAAAIATGGTPGVTGVFGDSIYYQPVLGAKAAESLPAIGDLLKSPLNIENSRYLAALNGPAGFSGALLGVESVAQQVERAGGYVAIIGKQGPTFIFDDKEDQRTADPAHYLFVADDVANPALPPAELTQKPELTRTNPASAGGRDKWLLQFVLDRALPAARVASAHGRPAFIVFWQHNPDLVQHMAGLGTQPALDALHQCDDNLNRLESAIAKLGLKRMTDLMIVSDHGFATVRMSLSLADLLVGAGIKHSKTSDDIVVARNGGEDLVYLSSDAFPTKEQRRATLARIVDFAEAQEWCGTIFSRDPAPPDPKNSQNHLGWIPGTFAQEAVGLYNSKRSPDLIISFRELPNLDNKGLTGPGNPAFELDLHGQVSVKNVSATLVEPIAGAVYSDASSFSTGMGIHGAAGQRELHNFCAVAGPDFRRRFVDDDPTSNGDLAATIRRVLGQPNPAGASGRQISEIFVHGARRSGAPRQRIMTSYLVLQGQRVMNTLYLTDFDGQEYLDDSSVSRQALDGSP